MPAGCLEQVGFAGRFESQREIEQAVRKAIEDGLITCTKSLPATVTLEVPREAKREIRWRDPASMANYKGAYRLLHELLNFLARHNLPCFAK